MTRRQAMGQRLARLLGRDSGSSAGYDDSVKFYRDVFKWDTHVASDSAEFRSTTLGEGEEQLLWRALRS